MLAAFQRPEDIAISEASPYPHMKKVNLESIPWVECRSPRARFHKFRRNIATALERPKAGPKLPGKPPFEVELVRVPPGATNFPLHSHSQAWEFYLILSGTATLRLGRRKVKVTAGDCIMCPPGEPHHMINTGADDLTYYVVANNVPGDIWHFPDSGKWGGHDLPDFFRPQKVDYFDGEE
jgi:uncharacterized cupin superfamily protein